MATYAIGDVQGCLVTLGRLLERIGFEPERDELWFAGDLVNRGPHSLETLRSAMRLGDVARTVLGNHDLLLLAMLGGVGVKRKKHTLHEILRVPEDERERIVAWLRSRPLMIRERGFALVHAGLHPLWSVEGAQSRAREAEEALRSDAWREVLPRALSKEPLTWSERLRGAERAAAILRVLVTIRTCTGEGTLDAFSGPPEQAPEDNRPWYELRKWHDGEETILFGHWAALGYRMDTRFVSLDSACVWGGSLTALRLEDRAVFQEPMADAMDRDPRFRPGMGLD